MILDGYPRRENRALNFRFFVVLPHEAIPLDRRLSKPLLTQQILSGIKYTVHKRTVFFVVLDILQTQISELTHGLGWQVLSFERYPRFDSITTFMNYTLIIIAIIAFGCMFFLAYWSNTIVYGSFKSTFFFLIKKPFKHAENALLHISVPEVRCTAAAVGW